MSVAKPKLMTVHYADGREVQAPVGPKAQVMVERRFGTTLAKLAEDAGAEASYYLAWAALSAAKLEHREFDEFLDAIDEVEAVVDEPTADPTGGPGRSPGPSSS